MTPSSLFFSVAKVTQNKYLLAFTLTNSSITPLSSTFANFIRIRSIGPIDSLRNLIKLLRISIFCQMIVTSWPLCGVYLTAVWVAVAWAGNAVHNVSYSLAKSVVKLRTVSIRRSLCTLDLGRGRCRRSRSGSRLSLLHSSVGKYSRQLCS